MTTEYDLPCANCDGPLARQELPPDDLEFDVTSTLPVAECERCGSRYYPTEALEEIGREVS